MGTIQQYDLDVNASLGVDESSRLKSNYHLDVKKADQTGAIMMYLFHLDIKLWESFINQKQSERSIKSTDEYPESLIPYINTLLEDNHITIATYLTSLKFIIIYSSYKNGEISPINAILELCRFMREEINCMIGIMKIIGIHAFGGDSYFNKIIMPNMNLPSNERLHRIFNGAIDLAYPTIMHHAVRYQSHLKTGDIKRLIPVFVSADRRLSKLYSLCQLHLIVDNQAPINYCGEAVSYGYNSKLSWSSAELDAIIKAYPSDYSKIGFDNKPRIMNNVMSLIEEYEEKVKLI